MSNAKVLYKQAYRNARISSANDTHRFSDQYNLRYFEPCEFVQVPDHIQDAAKTAHMHSTWKLNGWITSAGRVICGALANKKRGTQYLIPVWLREKLYEWKSTRSTEQPDTEPPTPEPTQQPVEIADNPNVVVTPDTPFKDSYNITAYGVKLYGLSREKRDLFIDGTNGKLTDIVQKIVADTDFTEIRFTLPNGIGNYGTYYPIYIPQFTVKSKIILKVLNKPDAWNLLGYVLGSMSIVKQSTGKNHLDCYYLEQVPATVAHPEIAIVEKPQKQVIIGTCYVKRGRVVAADGTVINEGRPTQIIYNILKEWKPGHYLIQDTMFGTFSRAEDEIEILSMSYQAVA